MRKNNYKVTPDFDIQISSQKRDKKGKTVSNGSFHEINIGFYLLTPLLLGVFLGLYLDSKLHTRPIGTIVCIIIGSLGTFYNLIRLTK